MVEIIHKDKNFVICKKPIGVHSQKADGKNMLTLLSDTLKIPETEIYPIHRLDNLVGGTMVYATSKDGARKLSTIVSNNEMQKTYLAVIHGKPEKDCDTLKDLLFKDSSKNKSFVVRRMRKGVKEASLEYTVLKTHEHDGNQLSLVKILLHTGRTHQIRVQFSSRGFPLAGDRRYGSGKDNCSVALHSYSLEFTNPFTNKKELYTADPDWSTYPWNLFN